MPLQEVYVQFSSSGSDDKAGQISLTMASIDPTEEPSELTDASQIRRSTLKVIRLPFDVDSDSEDSEDDEDLSELEDDEDSDAEVNGGPSDLSKTSSKSKKAALLEALANDEDDDMADGDEDLEGGKKGISEIAKAIQAVKGKDKALDSEDDSELDDEDEDSLPFEPDEVVVCTLDPTQVSSHHLLHACVHTDFTTALPASPQHHSWRRRASLLQSQWHTYRSLDWQLRDSCLWGARV